MKYRPVLIQHIHPFKSKLEELIKFLLITITMVINDNNCDNADDYDIDMPESTC